MSNPNFPPLIGVTDKWYSDSQVFLEVLLKGTLFPGNGSQSGEVLSPIHGEMRLQSDFAISQDPRTACLWQGFISK